jgi:hypothetical protein
LSELLNGDLSVEVPQGDGVPFYFTEPDFFIIQIQVQDLVGGVDVGNVSYPILRGEQTCHLRASSFK